VTKNGRDDDNPGRFGQSNVVSRADVDDDDDGRTLSYFLYFARTHGDQKESQSLRQLSVYNRREKINGLGASIQMSHSLVLNSFLSSGSGQMALA
jgi:hypothetical protein